MNLLEIWVAITIFGFYYDVYALKVLSLIIYLACVAYAFFAVGRLG